MVRGAGVSYAEPDRNPVQESGFGGGAGLVVEFTDKENDLVGSRGDFAWAEERCIRPAVRIGGDRLHQGRRSLRAVPPQLEPHSLRRPAGGKVEHMCGEFCRHLLTNIHDIVAFEQEPAPQRSDAPEPEAGVFRRSWRRSHAIFSISASAAALSSSGGLRSRASIA